MTFDDWIAQQEAGVASCDHMTFGRLVWQAAINAQSAEPAPFMVELDAAALEHIATFCIAEHDATDIEDKYSPALLWVGEALDDDGTKIYGLNLSLAEYPDEGCVPLVGLDRPANCNKVTFQHRVQPWMMACFGPEISSDYIERNHRFLEEALELVQACDCTQDEAHQLVDYVFGRDVGDKPQEVGGVMVTLAALCLAQGMDMHQAGEVELARIWTKVEQIRAKQATKPKHSPLPIAIEAHEPKNVGTHVQCSPCAGTDAPLCKTCQRFGMRDVHLWKISPEFTAPEKCNNYIQKEPEE